MVTMGESNQNVHSRPSMQPTIEQVWSWLEEVPDPEIPVLSVVDLGIVRDMHWQSGNGETELIVTITPTYSGCPATEVISRDICLALQNRGIRKLRLETRLSPAWSTDWLSPKSKERLRQFGIAPPARQLITPTELGGSQRLASEQSLVAFPEMVRESVPCPRCGSGDTEMTSRYGSTPCKALYRCKKCTEPFEYFKCH